MQNRGPQSLILNGGHEMALRPLYEAICPQVLLWILIKFSKTFKAPIYWQQKNSMFILFNLYRIPKHSVEKYATTTIKLCSFVQGLMRFLLFLLLGHNVNCNGELVNSRLTYSLLILRLVNVSFETCKMFFLWMFYLIKLFTF